jgi:hypothetical protein
MISIQNTSANPKMTSINNKNQIQPPLAKEFFDTLSLKEVANKHEGDKLLADTNNLFIDGFFFTETVTLHHLVRDTTISPPNNSEFYVYTPNRFTDFIYDFKIEDSDDQEIFEIFVRFNDIGSQRLLSGSNSEIVIPIFLLPFANIQFAYKKDTLSKRFHTNDAL